MKEESSDKPLCNFDSQESNYQIDGQNLSLHADDHFKFRNKCNNDDFECDIKCNQLVPNVALPRSLGLGRKWRGPVRYPVTPIKHTNNQDASSFLNASDDEQIFI